MNDRDKLVMRLERRILLWVFAVSTFGKDLDSGLECIKCRLERYALPTRKDIVTTVMHLPKALS